MDHTILQRAHAMLRDHSAKAAAAADALTPFLEAIAPAVQSRPRVVTPRRARRVVAKPAPKTNTPPVPPPAKTGRATRDQVRAFIGEAKGASTEDVANKFGVTTIAAYCHLNKLRNDGELVLGGDKKWRRAAAPTTNAPAVN